MRLYLKSIVFFLTAMICLTLMGCAGSRMENAIDLGDEGYSDVSKQDIPAIKLLLVYDDLYPGKGADFSTSTARKIYSLVKSDVTLTVAEDLLSSTFSLNESGKKISFDQFLSPDKNIQIRNSSNVYKIYLKGKEPQAPFKGWEDDNNVVKMQDVLLSILASYNYKKAIELHLVGAGTGAIGLKHLITRINENKELSGFVYLKTAFLIDPAIHTTLYQSEDLLSIRSYPQILSPEAKVIEAFAMNFKSKKLKRILYRSKKSFKWLEQMEFPGSHSQVTGIQNGPLSYAPLTVGINHIDKVGLFDLETMSLEDTLQMQLSIIMLQNPYTTRSLIEKDLYY